LLITFDIGNLLFLKPIFIIAISQRSYKKIFFGFILNYFISEISNHQKRNASALLILYYFIQQTHKVQKPPDQLPFKKYASFFY